MARAARPKPTLYIAVAGVIFLLYFLFSTPSHQTTLNQPPHNGFSQGTDELRKEFTNEQKGGAAHGSEEAQADIPQKVEVDQIKVQVDPPKADTYPKVDSYPPKKATEEEPAKGKKKEPVRYSSKKKTGDAKPKHKDEAEAKGVGLKAKPVADKAKDQHDPSKIDKQLIVAAITGDDVSWIQKRLKGWKANVYRADDPDNVLTVPKNKGSEHNMYLTYLIDHYDALPEVMVFVHGRQFQWHNDDPNYDGASMLSLLQVPHILKAGYVNLRCVWVLGCPDEMQIKAPRGDKESEEVYLENFKVIFPDRPVPDVIGVACCAQFGLSREQALKVPREELIRIREWLYASPLPDSLSGRIMEYSWHMLFGKGPIHCPNAAVCYCQVFGLCELAGCNEAECPGRYLLPQYSTQPEDWAPLAKFDKIDYSHEPDAVVMIDGHKDDFNKERVDNGAMRAVYKPAKQKDQDEDSDRPRGW